MRCCVSLKCLPTRSPVRREIFDGFFCVNLAPATAVDVTVLQRADLVIVNETESAWYGDSLKACPGMIATTFGAAGAVLSKVAKTWRE